MTKMIDKNLFDEAVKGMKEIGMPIQPERNYVSFKNATSLLERCLNYFTQRDAVWLPCYDKVAEWLADNEGKGLLLMGDCGLGKTVIATQVIPTLMSCYYRRIFKVYNGQDMNRKLDQALCYPLVVLDDVGTEGDSVVFGERRKAFSELVDNAERTGHLLVITTNLTPEKIKEKYGERTLDRLRGITKCIPFSGKSFRNSAT